MQKYKDKVNKALSLAESMEDIDYIQDKISSTDSINRRTVEGREFTKKLLELCNKRWIELFGDIPF